MGSAMHKQFDSLTKIKIQIDKIDIRQIANNFIPKK